MRPALPPLPDGDVEVSTGHVRLVRQAANPGSVTLYLNEIPSSQLDLADPLHLEFEYMQQMMCALSWAFPPPQPLRAVHLGGGGCALPRAIDAERPGSRQIVAEADERLASLVRTWFALPRAPRLKIRAADALDVLASRPDGSAQVIVRDAFAPDEVPAHLTTTGFLSQLARVLEPGGLYLANCAGKGGGDNTGLLRREIAGALATFESVALIAEPGQFRGRRHGNVVLLAQAGPFAPLPDLERALRRLPFPARAVTGKELADFACGAKPVQAPHPASPRQAAGPGQPARSGLPAEPASS